MKFQFFLGSEVSCY